MVKTKTEEVSINLTHKSLILNEAEQKLFTAIDNDPDDNYTSLHKEITKGLPDRSDSVIFLLKKLEEKIQKLKSEAEEIKNATKPLDDRSKNIEKHAKKIRVKIEKHVEAKGGSLTGKLFKAFFQKTGKFSVKIDQKDKIPSKYKYFDLKLDYSEELTTTINNILDQYQVESKLDAITFINELVDRLKLAQCIDNEAILNDLKDSKPVTGAMLTEGHYLRID